MTQRTTPTSERIKRVAGHPPLTLSPPVQNQRQSAKISGWRVAMLAAMLLLFGGLQLFIPLRTAVQIGADEGFELAKATLCLKGYQLYSDVWTDHPPLHTWLITQAIKLQPNVALTPALAPSDSGTGVSPV